MSNTPPLPLFRRANLSDLPALISLENACFNPERRDSPSTLRRSLLHPQHEVWVLDQKVTSLEAALFLRQIGQTLRLQSLAVHPNSQTQGRGTALLKFAVTRLNSLKLKRMTLEVDDRIPFLRAWYEKQGFRKIRSLPHYYAPNHSATRLSFTAHHP